MEKQLEELIKQYQSIVNQSSLMMTRLSDKVDRAKVEAGKISLQMVIDDLTEVLNISGTRSADKD